LVVGDAPHDAHAAPKAGVRTTGLLRGGFSEESLRRLVGRLHRNLQTIWPTCWPVTICRR
jgi:hypothetical protein